ncbi:MFS transporter [Actinospica sp. MGRD01-02]|uniref:MFS transporter n=1 Tax=Actinospica acidithermotolerans TaxID=2828514 RepID=A0A941E997_9ACTN|nr:MFS transporter [Actinospica acidithermotolerans]MBR7826922.1 MFS transporter [Actinospica acidithermotolerans]
MSQTIEQQQPTEERAPAPEAKQPSLWRSRDYLGLWTGDAISALGTSMSTIAYPLLVLFSSGSVAHAGVITAAAMIGSLLTTLWGGVLADRVSRKALLILSPLIEAAAVGAVALLVLHGRTSIAVLAVAACVGGLAGGVHTAARNPALRRIVPKEQMAVASSQVQGRDMAAQFFGSPLGGLLFSAARWLPFGVDSVTFLFSALGATLIRRPLGPDRTTEESRSRSMLADLREGLGYVKGVPFLRFVALWTPAINMAAGAYFLLFIAVLKYRGAGPAAIGLVNSIALLGGVTGAVLGPMILRRIQARRVLMTACWIFTGAAALTGVLPTPAEIGGSVFLVMLAVVPVNALFAAYQVRLVPDKYNGRASAVVGFGAQALQWIGPLVAGALADALGAPAALLIVAAALVPLAVAPHLSSSLALLERPVEEVAEHRP